MDALLKDIRFGSRMLIRRPGFTLIALLTLALGIAVTTATFSVVDGVLLRKLPVVDPDGMVVVHNQMPAINLPRTPVSALQFNDYSLQKEAFESTAAFTGRNFNLSGVGVPERLQAGRVTANFFPMLGINPIAGRTFNADEDRLGGEHVVVLSESLWRRSFGSSASVINSSIQLNGESYQIVGVAPRAIEEIYPSLDLWTPMAFTQRELSEERRNSLFLTMVARLKQGTNIKQAQAIMAGVARSIAGNDSSFGIEVRSLQDEYVSDVRRPLFVLLCAVLVVLLISCANVANLLLARASVRGREIAVRVALGAGRSRIIQQLFTESLLIAIIGGVLGILFAVWGTKAILVFAPRSLPRVSAVHLDVRVLLFSLAITVISGVVFGIIPAVTASKTDLVSSLKDTERGDSASSSRQWLRRAFVISEVALALVLLISAGLFVRSFGKLLKVKPGFDPHNVLTLRLALPTSQYDKGAKITAFYDDALARISALPGVEHTAAAFQTPFTGGGGDSSMFSIRDRRTGPDDPRPHADYAFVSWDYFQALGLPIRRGRGFQPADMRVANQFGSNSVVIVDEELAKRFWPNGDALGAGIGWGDDGPWWTVVGICATAQLKDLTTESKGTFYLPAYFSSSTIVVRTVSDPRALTSRVREQILAVDPNQPLYDVQTMDERVAASLETQRFAVVLLGIFGTLALLLAAIGLYGVLAFTVSQRTREIGIHLALGAQRRDVLAMVIRQGMLLVFVGAGLGVAGAYVLTRLIQSLLFEVTATDPLTFVSVPLVLAVVGFIACYVPARRATKVDPLVALRYE
ncbi:MAG TPA: ABC transporter permease [Pyrinomonadaceae bacterium]|jgi:Acidobacterial duplicated orphan permease|nr:ABC transporter permease [Pyrinomonadaceae bacterium]